MRRLLPQVPLARLYRALRAGDIRVNGARVAPATRTREADLIWVCAALARAIRETDDRPAAGDLPAILFRGDGVMVIDKPAGLPVHGGPDSVLARLLPTRAPAGRSLSFTPGPVHQLDRITTGALVIAETLDGARRWSAALRGGQVVKLYLALVEGDAGGSADGAPWVDTLEYDRRRARAIRAPAGRPGATGAGPKPAYASTWTLAVAPAAGPSDGPVSLLLVQLFTGRRHQIRAQAALRGHPLLGDRRYGSRTGPAGPALPLLHAAAIRNDRLPAPAAVVAPLPPAARRVIDARFGPGSARRAEAAVRARLDTPDRTPAAGRSAP